MEKILVIDIGNSEIDFGLFQNETIIHRFSLNYQQLPDKSILKSNFNNILYRYLKNIYIGSVNPKYTRIIAMDCKKYFSIQPYIIQHPVKTNLRIKYKPISKLGLDRIANAHAASLKYPLPVIVIDFGTATTLNIINQKKEFLGGMITIGLGSAAKALYHNTALLPEVILDGNIARINNPIASTTLLSIQSGLLHGFGAMVDGLIERIKKQLKLSKINIIATGGYAETIKPYAKAYKQIEPDLTLWGFYYLGLNRENRK